MSCLTEMMPLPIVSPSGNRAVDHRLLLGVALSSDRSWLHLYEGCNMLWPIHPRCPLANANTNIQHAGNDGGVDDDFLAILGHATRFFSE